MSRQMARMSNALGAVHGKSGSYEANSYAVEFIVFFDAADYGGFGEKIGCSLIGPRRTEPGDDDGEVGKDGQFVSGEKGKAAPAYFQGGGGIVVLLARGVQPSHPDGDGRFYPALTPLVFVGGLRQSRLILSGSDCRFCPVRVDGERGEERVHAVEHLAGLARALNLPP